MRVTSDCSKCRLSLTAAAAAAAAAAAVGRVRNSSVRRHGRRKKKKKKTQSQIVERKKGRVAEDFLKLGWELHCDLCGGGAIVITTAGCCYKDWNHKDLL